MSDCVPKCLRWHFNKYIWFVLRTNALFISSFDFNIHLFSSCYQAWSTKKRTTCVWFNWLKRQINFRLSYFKLSGMKTKNVCPILTLDYLLIGESDFQSRLRRRFPLHPVPRLRRLRHAPFVQVLPGAVPQHGGLLHIASHWEEDLHPLHGDLFGRLHPNVHLRDDLPHLQAHT